MSKKLFGCKVSSIASHQFGACCGIGLPSKENLKEIEVVLSQADKCNKELANQIEQIDRNLKLANALHEHKQAIEPEEEKIKLQQEAAERANGEQLGFEQKRLKLQQQHAQTRPETQYGANSGAVKMSKLDKVWKFDNFHMQSLTSKNDMHCRARKILCPVARGNQNFGQGKYKFVSTCPLDNCFGT